MCLSYNDEQKWQILILLKKKTYWVLYYLLKQYVNKYHKMIFLQEMKLSPFSKSPLKPKDLVVRLFSKTCSEGIDL